MELLAPLASSELLSLLPTWRASTQSHMYVQPVLTPKASDTAESDAPSSVTTKFHIRREGCQAGWMCYMLYFRHMSRVCILDQELELICF